MIVLLRCFKVIVGCILWSQSISTVADDEAALYMLTSSSARSGCAA